MRIERDYSLVGGLIGLKLTILMDEIASSNSVR